MSIEIIVQKYDWLTFGEMGGTAAELKQKEFMRTLIEKINLNSPKQKNKSRNKYLGRPSFQLRGG